MTTSVLDRPAPTIDAPAEAAPPAPAPLPRLSQVMREGCRYHRQGRSQLYSPVTRGTCAIGAAIVGLVGPGWTQDEPDKLDTLGPRTIGRLIQEGTGVDLDQLVMAPAPLGHYEHTLGTIIIRLNDGYHWSREQIADWLESIGL